jgi:hypothetical protein
VSTVVDNLRRTHRSTRLSIVETYTFATASDVVRVDAIATEGVNGDLTDLVLRELRYEVRLVAVVSAADSYVGLTTTGDDAERV